jgi:hypothetical protein
MKYNNDSSAVKKCLEYQEFIPNIEIKYKCKCHCQLIMSSDKQESTLGKKWFDQNEMYTSRYRMDFNRPEYFKILNNFNNQSKLELNKKNYNEYAFKKPTSTFTITKNLEDINKTNGYNKSKQSPILVKSISKTLSPPHVVVNIVEKKCFQNLKDHFPNRVDDEIKILKSSTQINNNEKYFRPISPGSSLFSSDIDKDLNINNINFKSKNFFDSLSLKNKKKDKSTINKTFFVEPILSKSQQVKIKNSSKNTCKHINLVCDNCVKKFDPKKHKLYEFDLSNLNKN